MYEITTCKNRTIKELEERKDEYVILPWGTNILSLVIKGRNHNRNDL